MSTSSFFTKGDRLMSTNFDDNKILEILLKEEKEKKRKQEEKEYLEWKESLKDLREEDFLSCIRL